MISPAPAILQKKAGGDRRRRPPRWQPL